MLADGRYAWVQMARGRARLNGTALEEGDGAAASNEATIDIAADGPAEILVFDLG